MFVVLSTHVTHRHGHIQSVGLTICGIVASSLQLVRNSHTYPERNTISRGEGASFLQCYYQSSTPPIRILYNKLRDLKGSSSEGYPSCYGLSRSI